MHNMSERVWKREWLKGCKEQPEVDIRFDGEKASQKRAAYSSQDENFDQRYKGFDALSREYDRRFSYEPLIDDRDGLRRLHEDYCHIRKRYVRELARGRDSIISKSSAHYCGDRVCKRPNDEHVGSSHDIGYRFCQDCGSSRCRRGSERSQLHQDVYRDNYARLDDVYLNDFQSDIDRLESGRKHRDESGWKWAIDKGRDDYQQRSSDVDSSSDINITTPPRKISTGICQKFLQGLCWRGASCWYVHDVDGTHSPHRLAGLHDGLLSGNNSPSKDGYLYSHTSNTTDTFNSRTSKPRIKRYIRSNAGEDCFIKKRRTESLWRYEDYAYSEEGGKIKRKSDSRLVRRGYDTHTEDSAECKTADESLERSESNDVIGRRRHKIGRRESNSYSIDGSEISDRRSENDVVNISSRRITREMNGCNDKRFRGKHSRKDNFHRATPLRNVSGSSRRLSKDESAVLCKHFMKGICGRGNNCCFSHGIESSKTLADMEVKRSLTERASEATNEMSIMETSIHDAGKKLCSTRNTKRPHLKKDQNSGGSDAYRPLKSSAEHSDTITGHAETFSGKKCAPETDMKDRHPDKGKKISGSQEGAHDGDCKNCSENSAGKKIAPEHDMQKDHVNNENNICGNQEGKADDECGNYLMGHTDMKTSSAQQIVVGKKAAGDPFPLNLMNIISEIPSVSLASCVEIELTDETSKSHQGMDLFNLPSASLKGYVCKVSESEATSASCYASKTSCPPCPLKVADDIFVAESSDKNSVNLDSQFLSDGPEVSGAEKARFSNGFEKSPSLERLLSEKSVEMPNQPELQESCASVGEQDRSVNLDQSVGSSVDKKPSLCQKVTCDITGCYEKVVNHSEATTASTDQVEKEMPILETCPFTSNANSASSFEMQGVEEASCDDIGLDMSLDDYICRSLSLEHFICNMEGENEAIICSYAYKEPSSFLEDTSVAMTSENPIQLSNGYSQLPTCDGISETKPILPSFTVCSGLNHGRIASKEMEEVTKEPNFERHENFTSNEQEKRPSVKLQPIDAGNRFMEEPNLHVNKELGSSQKQRNVILATENLDKNFDSSRVGQNSETKPISSLTASGQGSDFETNISEKSGAIPSGPRTEQYDSLTSEHDKEETRAHRLKEPDANLEANEKCSSVVDSSKEATKFKCYESHVTDCKSKEGKPGEDEKLLLKLALLEFAKEILDPLWKAGRISNKDTYKTIARKVVNKVSASVQGAHILRTKENVDVYLQHHKPKIAQLVLAYVNVYPVQL